MQLQCRCKGGVLHLILSLSMELQCRYTLSGTMYLGRPPGTATARGKLRCLMLSFPFSQTGYVRWEGEGEKQERLPYRKVRKCVKAGKCQSLQKFHSRQHNKRALSGEQRHLFDVGERICFLSLSFTAETHHICRRQTRG